MRRTVPWDLLFFGLYFAGLGVFRGVELLSLPSDVVIEAPFPSWLIAYLSGLVTVVFLSGALLLGAAGVSLGNRSLASRLALLGAGGALTACLAHAVFLARWEWAFAQGGLIPGIMDTLLLTRTYDPTYTEQHAIIAYRVGQFAVMLLWGSIALFVLARSAALRTLPHSGNAARAPSGG